MKKHRVSGVFLVVSLLVVLLLAGCGNPPEASFTANPTSGGAPLNVSFSNTSTEADEYLWDFGDGSSDTTYTLAEPIQHEYTQAGTFTVNLTAAKGEKPDTGSAVLSVSVEPGPIASVTLSPASVELEIGETVEFTVKAADGYGNEVSGVNLDWQSDYGNINNGTFTAGTTSGSFSEGVSLAMEKNGSTATGYAEVTIKPGPMATLSIEPTEVTAGESVQLAYLAEDENGNPVNGLDATWSVASVYTGSVTGDGLLTAGKRTGTISGVIAVEVTDGDTTLTASGDITVLAGALTRVGIAPDTVEIGIGMMQQMVAAGADRFGNRISDIDFTWATSEEAGTITASGLFTAGQDPDTYADSITVSIESGGDTITASVDVTIILYRTVSCTFLQSMILMVENLTGTL